MTQLKDVSLTSDRDYIKIVSDGALTISANGSLDADMSFPYAWYFASFGGSSTINHNIGSVPLIRAFWDPLKDGTWWKAHVLPNNFEIDPWLDFVVTTTTLKLMMLTGGAAKTDIPVFYRIYDMSSKAADSDSRMDKIFKKDSSSGVASAAPATNDPTYTVITIPHGDGEPPLWTLQFSEDGINWTPEGSRIIGPPDTTTGPPGGPYTRYYYTKVYGSADKNNFYIWLENVYASSKTIYYRYALDYRQ